MIPDIKKIDQFVEVEVEEESKSFVGGGLTVLTLLLTIGYGVYSYMLNPIIVDSRIEFLTATKKVPLTCKCLHPDGCVFMSSCSSDIDDLKFVDSGSRATLTGCFNASNKWTFAFRPKRCGILPVMIVNSYGYSSKSYSCATNEATCSHYTNCSSPSTSFQSRLCLHTTEKDGEWGDDCEYGRSGSIDMYVSQYYYCSNEWSSSTRTCYCGFYNRWSGSQEGYSAAMLTKDIAYEIFDDAHFSYVYDGNLNRIPGKSIVDCRASSEWETGVSNPVTVEGEYTLTETTTKESGAVANSLRFVKPLDGYVSNNISTTNQLFLDAVESVCGAGLRDAQSQTGDTSYYGLRTKTVLNLHYGAGFSSHVGIKLSSVYVKKSGKCRFVFLCSFGGNGRDLTQ